MTKRIFLSVLFLFSLSAGFCQVDFQTNAPRMVAVGEPFRIEFVLSHSPDHFTPPAFDNFDLIAGPQISQGQYFEFINGKSSQRETYTYTYVVSAKKTGNLSIGAATAVVDGKNYVSKSIPVEVLENKSLPAGGSQTAPSGQQSAQQGSQGQLRADDVLLKMQVSSTNVYKGEPIRVSVKLYTRVDIAGIESPKFPAFNGFWTQDLNVDHYEWQREEYNRSVYNSRIIKEYLIFPQKSGTLDIERLDMTVVAQVVTQRESRSFFDDFFGGGAMINNVRKPLSAGPVKITVNELPAGAPAGFSGAVGRFSMEGTVSSGKMAVNSSGHIRLKLSGTGNFPLVETPLVSLPSSFELYDVKTDDNYRTGTSGISGSREFEYPFIARAEGEYIVSPIEFSYFDPSQKKYKTLTVPQFRIEVVRDSTGGSATGTMTSGVSKENLKILGKDIRFIRVGEPGLKSSGTLFMWSWKYMLIMLLIALLFAGILIYLRKLIRERQNITLVRNKTANRIAVRRLKTAKRLLSENKEGEFYQEMLRALWGYLSDKLNIPVAGLSKDNIREKLSEYPISGEDVDMFLQLISECEYARYAPGSVTPMTNMYQISLDLIGRFESKIRR